MDRVRCQFTVPPPAPADCASRLDHSENEITDHDFVFDATKSLLFVAMEQRKSDLKGSERRGLTSDSIRELMTAFNRSYCKETKCFNCEITLGPRSGLKSSSAGAGRIGPGPGLTLVRYCNAACKAGASCIDESEYSRDAYQARFIIMSKLVVVQSDGENADTIVKKGTSVKVCKVRTQPWLNGRIGVVNRDTVVANKDSRIAVKLRATDTDAEMVPILLKWGAVSLHAS